MPAVESEVELIEVFSKAKVIAITINHEDMSDEELESTICEYEYKHELPTTDVLKHGCGKLIKKLFEVFPELHKQELLVC